MDATKRVKANPTYCSWQSMRYRCGRDKHYKEVTYDPRWDDYEVFLEDMGERPVGYTLERKDNSKGYSKRNCCWATREEQSNNRGYCRKVVFRGETRTVSQWAKHYSIPIATLFARLDNGWAVEKALTTSVRKYGNHPH